MAESAGRTLILLRHAKSAWPDVPDHERPLANRGRRDAPAVGHWLRAAGYVPDQVLCSTARRAWETWLLAAAGLGTTPPVSAEDRVYRASAAELLELIRQVPAGPGTLLVVGHAPSLPDLALMLAEPAAGMPGGGHGARDLDELAPLDRMRAKFPTAALAVLEFTGAWPQLSPGHARLAAFMRPGDIPGWQPGSR